MEAIVLRGTTLHGNPINLGDIIEVDEDTFRKMAVAGDIAAPANPVPSELVPEESEPKPTKKKAK